MKKYRVDTQSWSSKEYDSFEQAMNKYEITKDWEMGEGVTEDSYVELVVSEDDFEDHKVLKRAMAVVDKERMAKGLPREEGKDFDYWAKWEELIQSKLVHEENSEMISTYAENYLNKKVEIAEKIINKLTFN